MRFGWIAGVSGALVAALVAFAGLGYREARADPIVRRASIALPDWPAGAAPVTIALLGDIHIGSAAMDAERLTRIVAQVDALHPDLVLIAGDMVFGHDAANGARFAERLRAPLSRLHAPLGVVAVPGNHDHWTALPAIERALRQAGVTILANGSTVRGPLAIVGVDDAFSGHADSRTALAGHGAGAVVMVSHSPDVVPLLWHGAVPLLLSAHTHCGQVVLPWIGPLDLYGPFAGHSLYDVHYRCGVIHDPGRTTIVTAGLGTSVAPIRWGAPPDLWLIRVGPGAPGISRLRS